MTYGSEDTGDSGSDTFDGLPRRARGRKRGHPGDHRRAENQRDRRCSLQEAIYSANFDSNIAISGYSGSTPIVVVTQCVPGSGDDIIVLPAAALMQFSNIVDDAYNPAGQRRHPSSPRRSRSWDTARGWSTSAA
jgi:hypothetical protein